MADHMSVIKTIGLAAGYGTRKVIEDINLSVDPGESLVLIGQNGSGKSTLLKSIGGFLPLISGTVRFHENLVQHLKPHELLKYGISFMTHGGIVIPALSVAEHLQLAARYGKNCSPSVLMEETLTSFPILKNLYRKKAGNLSGGERQLLSFAVLYVQGTSTWLLDEPTAGLSPEMVNLVTQLIERKQREGITILLVEHNLDVALQLATHVAVVQKGGVSKKFVKEEFLQHGFLETNYYS